MSKKGSIEFVAGLLIRRQIRNALDELIFRGEDISYHENKGWIDSTFTIKGNKHVVYTTIEVLNEHFGE
ncbi:hypothetical protein VPBG_00073 [Vibrio phage helene 12B3]|uniref:hypothetical protein n=1 Tax=Vibrio phage helene 12B3 TaxID=573173 RepID=UPI0002C11C51|nr:hypothetical protein VPBG_00073 [Vibrio phage helene 12B3]AGG57845.1 hypothetical protein VPBG_00073 [Vibrio phage helene 12B3]